VAKKRRIILGTLLEMGIHYHWCFIQTESLKLRHLVLLQNLKECSSNPCHNGGVCKDLLGSYECECLSGFTGDNCEINIDECESVVCPANSECVDGIGTYKCVCKIGFPGKLLFEYLNLWFSNINVSEMHKY
jgi:hypothetical protein